MFRRNRRRYKAYLAPGNEPSLPRTTRQRIRKAVEGNVGNVPSFNEPSTSSASVSSDLVRPTVDEQSTVNSDDSSCSSRPNSLSSSSSSESLNNSPNDYDTNREQPNLEDSDSDILDSEGETTEGEATEGETEDSILSKFHKYKQSKHFQQLNSPISSPTEPSSVFEVLFLIFHFSMRHNLSKVATQDLIKMINCILGTEAIPHSKYMFSQTFFSGIKYTFHLFCNKCSSYLGPKMEQGLPVACVTCSEESMATNESDIKFFVSISMEDQLKIMLENPNNQKRLSENLKKRSGSPSGTVKDIYDGKSYKKLFSEGSLSSENNISVTFNIDGAPVFKSSKSSIWPIQFICNELPPEDRFEPNNVMLAGLWFGDKDPKMDIFLIPFIKEALELSENGFEWTKESGVKVRSKVLVTNCSVDSVAKPLIQGVKQFNGYYGCGYCLHPGVGVGGTNQVRYVISPDFPDGYDYRSDRSLKSDAEESVRTGKSINGVRTISPLSVLPDFDLVFGFTIDYMHACLLGVTRMLSNLWFDSSNHEEEYYIGRDITKVNEVLCSIQPPSEITRLPRSLQERKYWKANEWRSWLLFYSLPCLHGILPARFFNHFLLFVTAMYVFLKDEMTYEEIDFGNMLLMNFVTRFQDLYGEINMVYNVHLLTHLGKIVSLWGPLWAYSAITFESGNGTLLKLVCGTRGVSSQIVDKYLSFKSVQLWLKVHSVSPSVLDFCVQLMSFPLNKTVVCNCSSNTVLLGNPVKKNWLFMSS
jgi:hypothetical protein